LEKKTRGEVGVHKEGTYLELSLALLPQLFVGPHGLKVGHVALVHLNQRRRNKGKTKAFSDKKQKRFQTRNKGVFRQVCCFRVCARCSLEIVLGVTLSLRAARSKKMTSVTTVLRKDRSWLTTRSVPWKLVVR
jgi:hypothetical protein